MPSHVPFIVIVSAHMRAVIFSFSNVPFCGITDNIRHSEREYSEPKARGGGSRKEYGNII